MKKICIVLFSLITISSFAQRRPVVYTDDIYGKYKCGGEVLQIESEGITYRGKDFTLKSYDWVDDQPWYSTVSGRGQRFMYDTKSFRAYVLRFGLNNSVGWELTLDIDSLNVHKKFDKVSDSKFFDVVKKEFRSGGGVIVIRGNDVQSFGSVAETARSLGLNMYHIYLACWGKYYDSHIYKGYEFWYKEDYEKVK